MTGITGNYADLLARAYAEADTAINAYVASHGGFDACEQGLNCGFAWVTVHPGNHSFVAWCRKRVKELEAAKANGDPTPYNARQFGSKGYPNGWQFWCPGNYKGQSVDVMAAGAKAFGDVLAHGLQTRVEVSSRLD